MARTPIAQMSFTKIYPLLVQKAERKGRTREEVDTVTCWLTGYDPEGLARQLERDLVDWKSFDPARMWDDSWGTLARDFIADDGGEDDRS